MFPPPKEQPRHIHEAVKNEQVAKRTKERNIVNNKDNYNEEQVDCIQPTENKHL